MCGSHQAGDIPLFGKRRSELRDQLGYVFVLHSLACHKIRSIHSQDWRHGLLTFMVEVEFLVTNILVIELLHGVPVAKRHGSFLAGRLCEVDDGLFA